MATIELRGIAKRFGSTEVIRALDLAIPAERITVLLGPSGCGKSTLLRMIAGLETPTAGEVAIDGRVVNDVPPAERGCALVFQNYALYPHKTVRQNLAFPLRMAHVDRHEQVRRIDEIAALLELAPLLDRHPRELSGGQRQRVAMGRAMIRRPRVFLYDEPLSNLDLELRVRLRLEIARLQRALQSTVVYVTHDQTEAMTLADQLVVMRGGGIEQVGAPLELYRTPANLFVAGFIGTPRMNLLEVDESRPDGDGTHLRIGTSELRLPRRYAAPVRTVGFRPEHAHLGAPAGPHEATLELRDAETLAVEHLGDRAFCHLRCALGDVVLPVGQEERPNGTLPLRIDALGVHAFDERGDALR